MVRMVGASSLGGWARGDLVMTHTPRPVAIQGMKTNSKIGKRYYEKTQTKIEKACLILIQTPGLHGLHGLHGWQQSPARGVIRVRCSLRCATQGINMVLYYIIPGDFVITTYLPYWGGAAANKYNRSG